VTDRPTINTLHTTRGK